MTTFSCALTTLFSACASAPKRKSKMEKGSRLPQPRGGAALRPNVSGARVALRLAERPKSMYDIPVTELESSATHSDVPPPLRDVDGAAAVRGAVTCAVAGDRPSDELMRQPRPAQQRLVYPGACGSKATGSGPGSAPGPVVEPCARAAQPLLGQPAAVARPESVCSLSSSTSDGGNSSGGDRSSLVRPPSRRPTSVFGYSGSSPVPLTTSTPSAKQCPVIGSPAVPDSPAGCAQQQAEGRKLRSDAQKPVSSRNGSLQPVSAVAAGPATVKEPRGGAAAHKSPFASLIFRRRQPGRAPVASPTPDVCVPVFPSSEAGESSVPSSNGQQTPILNGSHSTEASRLPAEADSNSHSGSSGAACGLPDCVREHMHGKQCHHAAPPAAGAAASAATASLPRKHSRFGVMSFGKRSNAGTGNGAANSRNQGASQHGNANPMGTVDRGRQNGLHGHCSLSKSMPSGIHDLTQSLADEAVPLFEASMSFTQAGVPDRTVEEDAETSFERSYDCSAQEDVSLQISLLEMAEEMRALRAGLSQLQRQLEEEESIRQRIQQDCADKDVCIASLREQLQLCRCSGGLSAESKKPGSRNGCTEGYDLLLSESESALTNGDVS